MTNLFLSAQQLPDNNFLILRARCLQYYIIMATFCWHIIITSDYKLMCRFVQVMEHCILFNVSPYLVMALISLYLIFTNHEDHIFNGFPTQVNATICLVIGSRKPSDQLASNIYINVIPISIALSKFLSCNDIILLEVHFFLWRKPVFRVI